MKNNITKYVIIGLGLLAAGILLKNLFKDKPKQNVVIINDWKKRPKRLSKTKNRETRH